MNELRTVHPVDKTLNDTKKNVSFYAWKVHKDCWMNQEDAYQELSIAAWLAILRYNEELPDCTIVSWVIAALHFKSLELTAETHRQERRRVRAEGLYRATSCGYENDPSEVLVKKLDLEARMCKLSTRQRRIVSMWCEGYKAREIAAKMNISIDTVERALHKVA